MSKKSRVGRSALFFLFFLLSAKPEIVVPGAWIWYFIFEISSKQSSVLKLFYESYTVFLPSLFFALNFDKKLAVEYIKHCCWLNNKNGYPNSV